MFPHPTRACRIVPGVSLLIVLLGSMSASAAPEDDAIPWREDYFAALEEAKANNRLLWVQFTGPWCPHCTRMEQDSFPHPAIVGHAKSSFVPVKLRSDVHEQLALSFNLSGLPATIIVAPNREIIATHQGYLGPDDFDAFLRQSLDQHQAKNKIAASATAGQSGRPTKPVGGRETQPKDAARPALEGYCPVSLVADRKLARGRADHAVTHRGRVYHLASAAMLERFQQEPDRYVPANEGSCPVAKVEHGRIDHGDPRWGVIYQNHLFLCATEENRRLFLRDPERYALADVAEQGFCLHCLRDSGALVRGDPREEVTIDGRRYWFPDSSHRDAFLEAAR
jgi:YHS domain-containing protein/thioredoxin-related protein